MNKPEYKQIIKAYLDSTDLKEKIYQYLAKVYGIYPTIIKKGSKDE